ncbi:MAG: L-threonylcarbamoyladenylate synthase, partial [Proteobacteria bacterium]|nr:L-threonylcarbamoyladenylate synthase [Pseudomonadota bacterium]
MSQFFTVHPTNPQPRLIKQAADLVRNGAVIAYPTDSCYALGCHLGDKEAVARIRQIRGVDDKHHMTMVCRDLSELARYARVDNVQFRLLKNNTPGSYTFILEATKEVPKRLQHPKRSTIGVRIPDHPVALALLEELGEPLISSTLILPNEEFAMNDAEQIRDLVQHQIDLVVDGGAVGLDSTTVIDLTKDTPVVVRFG